MMSLIVTISFVIVDIGLIAYFVGYFNAVGYKTGCDLGRRDADDWWMGAEHEADFQIFFRRAAEDLEKGGGTLITTKRPGTMKRRRR